LILYSKKYFSTQAEFQAWNKRKEEARYTTCIKGQQTYYPHDSSSLHTFLLSGRKFIFCMLGSDPSTSTITFAVVMATTGRIPSPGRQEKIPYQKEARKVNSTCTSSSGCIHDEFVDGSVQVEYIPAHTSRKL